MAAAEGQFIGEALFEIQPPIIVIGGVIAAPVDEEGQATVIPTDVPKALAPGERAMEREPMRGALGELCLQRVEVGREAKEVLIGSRGPAESGEFGIGVGPASIGAGQIDVLRTGN